MTEPWSQGELLVGGLAGGPLIALITALSFWGGVDPSTGVIVDPHHPQRGDSLAGVALLTGASKGSSSSTSTFLECVRLRTAPAVLLLTDPDPILVVAAAAAHEIYQHGPTVVLLSAPPVVADVATVQVNLAGRVFATRRG
jgi:predicted aconitase with swiveling domain